MVNLKLKRLLGMNEKNQMWLVRETGIRQPTISAICNNHTKSLSIDNIDKICKALDCTPADWIFYTPDDPDGD